MTLTSDQTCHTVSEQLYVDETNSNLPPMKCQHIVIIDRDLSSLKINHNLIKLEARAAGQGQWQAGAEVTRQILAAVLSLSYHTTSTLVTLNTD